MVWWGAFNSVARILSANPTARASMVGPHRDPFNGAFIFSLTCRCRLLFADSFQGFGWRPICSIFWPVCFWPTVLKDYFVGRLFSTGFVKNGFPYLPYCCITGIELEYYSVFIIMRLGWEMEETRILRQGAFREQKRIEEVDSYVRIETSSALQIHLGVGSLLRAVNVLLEFVFINC